MYYRTSHKFRNVLSGLVLSLMISFGIPSALLADEKASAVDEISLGDLLNLDTFMVTATKRKISTRKAPAIATVFTAAEIRSMGARNIADVLKMVPGFGRDCRHAECELQVLIRF